MLILSYCFNCSHFTFEEKCPYCEKQDAGKFVPLQVEKFSDFQYESRGFLYDLLHKNVRQDHLDTIKKKIIKQYNQYQDPYFDNFIQIVAKPALLAKDPALDKRIELLKKILIKLGFSEIKAFPELIFKLVRCTYLNHKYNKLQEKFIPHIKNTLEETLYSYQRENKNYYKQEFRLIIYYLYTNNLFGEELKFRNKEPKEIEKWFLKICQFIEENIILDNFKDELENYDSC